MHKNEQRAALVPIYTMRSLYYVGLLGAPKALWFPRIPTTAMQVL